MPPSCDFTIGATMPNTMAPTSQNRLTTMPPRQRRVSAHSSRISTLVERTMLVSISRFGAPSPVRGMNSDAPHEMPAKTSVRITKPIGLAWPSLDDSAATKVPAMMAMKVAPSTSALPEASSSRCR